MSEGNTLKLKIKKRFFHSGVELARFCAECEEIEGCDAINEFYGTLAQNAYKWFCESRYLQIVEEYEADSDPGKRFGKRVYEYLMRTQKVEEDERHVSVRCEATLKAGKDETLFSFCDIRRWDKELQIITKPKKKEKKEKR